MLVRLRISDHPAASWAGSVEPWLRAQGKNWLETRVILAPNSTWISALKASVVAAGLPCMGVAWFTPGKWRTRALRMLPGPTPRLALREDLHLLLELAAARLPANPLARAYGSDPAPFQELLDALEGAGWKHEALPDPAARELAALAVQLRAESGLITSARADQILADAASSGALPPMGEHLLAVGFGPSDWALHSLLESAATVYADTEFVFDIADALQPASTAWVGTWEGKMGGAAEWLAAPEILAPYAPLASMLVAPTPIPASVPFTVSELPPRLWLAENLQAEADLIVAQALSFLQDAVEDEPIRVGIVLGSVNSPLAREVAARFASLGLPHYDSSGHLPGRTPAQAAFEAWLDWQENGRLDGLVLWVRAAQRYGLVSEKSADKIETSLQAVAAATLSDGPAVIAAWLGLSPTEAKEAQAFFAEWPRLPESATWDDFLRAVSAVAQKLQWPNPPDALAERVAPWSGELTALLPRTIVVRWVRAVVRVPGRTRDALGREPLAPLQIVDVASAAAHPWTHLVLGGLQHGDWPVDEWDSPLLDEAHLASLNRRVQRQGRQGEGHWIVATGHGLLLSQADRRRLDRAAFARLVGLASVGLALTSRRTDPADGRPARFAEYFRAVAKSVLGRHPTETDWAILAEASQRQRESFLAIFAENSAPPLEANKIASLSGPEETGRAFAVRRNPSCAFDEYSFCFATPPSAPLRLSCKAWEEAVARPGAAWFKYLLKIKPRWDAATMDYARLSLGNWAHDWVRPGAGGSQPIALPGLEFWQALAADRAGEVRHQATKAFAAAGRELPESWLEVWDTARRISEQWISALVEVSSWPHVLAEVNLPPDSHALFPGGTNIPLSGRLDLLLLSRPVTLAKDSLGKLPVWLVDFKTGGDKALSVTNLAKGTGLQLALYAQALQSLGAGEIFLTLLNRDAKIEPQLDGEKLSSPDLTALWQLLGNYALNGRWGERHDLVDEYKQSGDYPSATLPISGEIVQKKWALTHPNSL